MGKRGTAGVRCTKVLNEEKLKKEFVTTDRWVMED